MALYSKYRPTSFDAVIGQDHITRTLQNALKQQKVAHAYLFAGPRGTGKTSVARILAKELGCDDLDVIEIDAASHRGIDEIRALREQVAFQPTSGDKKIYILDEVHMLTKEAFNALLKMIEEPPQFVHFVLCTTEPHKVPVTIISRTQRFDFKPGSQESIASLLSSVANQENIKIEQNALDIIASYAHGGYRDAESLLEQVVHAAGDDTITDDLVRSSLGLVDIAQVEALSDALLSEDYEKTMAMLNGLGEKQVNWQYFLSLLLDQLRGQILQGGKDTSPRLVQLVRTLITASRDIKYSPVAQLPIEIALFDWFKNEQPLQQSKQDPAQTKKASATVLKPDVQKVRPEPVRSETPKEEPSVITVKQGSVHELWTDILEAIKPYNHTLEALLKGCTPGDKDGDTLTLNFKYAFHKEKISEVQNKQIVEEVIQKVTGEKVTLRCIIDTNGAGNTSIGFHGNEEYHDEGEGQQNDQNSGKQKGRNADTIHTAPGDDPIAQAMKELEGTLIE